MTICLIIPLIYLLRDLYEISCEEIDFLVEQICEQEGAYGARLSGGGFGGTAVAIVVPTAAEAIKQRVTEDYKRRFGINCEIHIVKPSQAVEMIKL